MTERKVYLRNDDSCLSLRMERLNVGPLFYYRIWIETNMNESMLFEYTDRETAYNKFESILDVLADDSEDLGEEF